MQIIRNLLLIIFICFYFESYGQKELSLPYKGGSSQFEKDILTHLIVETLDSGRIYFVEVSLLTAKNEIKCFIHGTQEKDVTTRLIEDFFQRIKNKWDKKFLETSNIVIPLFIAPYNIDNPSNLGKVNMNQLAKIIGDSFKSKKCFLYKPVYSFNQNIHIDMEPQ